MEISNFTQISEQTTSSVYQWTFSQIESIGLHNQYAHILSTALLLIAAFMLLVILDWIIRFFFNTVVLKLINKTKSKWDNFLLDNRVHVHLGRVILIMILQQILPFIFTGFPSFTSVLITILGILIVIAIYSLVNGLLKTARDIARSTKGFEDKPVDSYLQVFQIFLIFVAATLIISQITGSSPWSFLVSLGAASAVLMLVFKDTILGFVASIQVSANDSVRVGDWIEMPKYGVDGDILQINLNNVRVRNWDKTIVTIPTYTLLSDSFKNYRGMQETGGRRIKRAINIKISTIRYLNKQEIDNLKKISLLAPIIEQREKEIDEFNQLHQVDPEVLVNGRRITNIGLFRAYIVAYAQHNPKIHKELTFLVRQLTPTEHGLPLELYMFTKGTQWAFYEDTMSDLFDHLFAAIKYFDLEVFELPSSDDLRSVFADKTPKS